MQERKYASVHTYYELALAVALTVLTLAVIFTAYVDWRTFGGDGINLQASIMFELLIFVLAMVLFGAFRIGSIRLYWLGYYAVSSVLIANFAMLVLPTFGVAYFKHWQSLLLLAGVQTAVISLWAWLFHKLYFKLFPKKRALVIAPTADDCAYCAGKMRTYSHEFDVSDSRTSDNVGAITASAFDSVIAYRLDKDELSKLSLTVAEAMLEFCVVPDFFELSIHKSTEAQFGDMLVFRAKVPGFSPEQRFVKRAMDLILATVGLTICSPIMLIFALVIWLQDFGSPLYLQARLTRAGRPFNIIKFRTMRTDAEYMTGPTLAQADDPRVTRFGKFLRRCRLDELPQFINVIKGDMSLVGPRPERPHFTELYEAQAPGFKMRLNVKAGMTGMAHVKGRYDTPPSERLNLDMYYITHYSVMLDVKILIETLLVLFLPGYAQGIKGSKQ